MPNYLPNSGPLSFSMIGNGLCSFTPFSLNAMSNVAGFTSPFSVSAFYGLGVPCAILKPFYITNETISSNNACYVERIATRPAWHDGAQPLPVVGDKVYINGAVLLPATIGGWYGMTLAYYSSVQRWIVIKSANPGVVFAQGSC